MKRYHLIIAYCLLLSGKLFATNITAVSSGSWASNSSWSCNCQPSNDDNITIPAGITINLNSTVVLYFGPVITITIGGTLIMNSSSIAMDSNDVMVILNGGEIRGVGLLGGSVLSGASPILIPKNTTVDGPKFITNGVMPIKLIYFRDAIVANGIQLEWASGSEENFDHYDIRRSIDGKSFTTIATIVGKSATGTEYTFTDASPLEGTNYYQLTAVDLDGTSEDFQVIKSEWIGRRDWVIVYPNPVSDGNIHAIFSGGESGSLCLFDSNGLVVAETFFGNAASCSLQLPSSATSGAYFLLAQMNGRVERIKVIVK